MARATRVKITKDGNEAYCMPSALKAWERYGWTRADDGSSSTNTKSSDSESAPEVSGAPEAATKDKRKAD